LLDEDLLLDEELELEDEDDDELGFCLSAVKCRVAILLYELIKK
jgi:hypothetical protein